MVELNKNTGLPVWEYHRDFLRTSRDSGRLPRGIITKSHSIKVSDLYIWTSLDIIAEPAYLIEDNINSELLILF